MIVGLWLGVSLKISVMSVVLSVWFVRCVVFNMLLVLLLCLCGVDDSIVWLFGDWNSLKFVLYSVICYMMLIVFGCVLIVVSDSRLVVNSVSLILLRMLVE